MTSFEREAEKKAECCPFTYEMNVNGFRATVQ